METSVFLDDEDSVLRNTKRGTPIWYYKGSFLRGKYYIQKIKRNAPKKYLIRATSAIGLIAEEEFYGGYYSGVKLGNIVDNILYSDGLGGYGLDTNGSYDVYDKFQSTGSTRSVELNSSLHCPDAWNYKMHCEFTVYDERYTGTVYGIVAGCYGGSTRGNYYVRWNNYYFTQSRISYFVVSIYYGFTSAAILTVRGEGSVYFGKGTKFTVDIDPVGGVATVVSDYVDARTGATGRQINTASFTAVSSDTYYPHLGYGCACEYYNGVYGYASANYTRYHSYQILSETDQLLLKAIMVTDTESTINYLADQVSGAMSDMGSYPFDLYGDVSFSGCKDIRMVDAMLAYPDLAKSIIYGEGIANISVYGWIPIGTKREALHQLLFAHNITILKTAEGKILFTYLVESTPTELSEDDVYNDTQEEYISAAHTISVTENTYLQNAEEVKLYDNANEYLRAGEYIVAFDHAPIFGTPIGNGIDILKFNCNAALVSGRGTITGTAYDKFEKVLLYENRDAAEGNDVSVSGLRLITYINSESVLEKLKSYYSGRARKVKNSIKDNGERCGMLYSFKSMFADENAGYLTKISARVSSFIKNTCEFVIGFTPVTTSGYTEETIILSGDEWEVPASVREKTAPTIELVIIGDGQDGTTGGNGAAGKSGSDGGNGGKGGTAGAGGAGGKIYQIVVDVTNVNKIVVANTSGELTVYAYDDNDSLVSTLSSASGISNSNGFTDLFTGTVYALPGEDGIDGGDGGDGKGLPSGQPGTAYIANSGEDAGSHSGGKGTIWSQRTDAELMEGDTAVAYYYSGVAGGGGASATENGGDAYTNGTASYTIVYPSYSETVKIIYAGNGANASQAEVTKTTYGCGGNGGHGGGGGGGGCIDYWQRDGSQRVTISRSAGAGGSGGLGSAGIDGCVIIYF